MDEHLTVRDTATQQIKADAQFFVLRTPTMPIEILRHLGEQLTARNNADGSREDLDAAVERDWIGSIERLRQIVRQPVFREALFVASPVLHAEVDAWLQDPAANADSRVTLSLAKYVARSSGRPTPFGLFSACSVGAVGQRYTSLRFADGPLVRRTRLDSEVLVQVCDALSAMPDVQLKSSLAINATLHVIGNRAHYIEAVRDGARTRFVLSATDVTPELRVVVDGPETTTVEELVAALQRSGLQPGEAREYIEDLVDGGVLVRSLGPVLLSADPVEELIKTLRASAAADDVADLLSRAQCLLKQLDDHGAGAAPTHYVTVAQLLRKLPAKAEPTHLVQLDAFRPLDGGALSSAVTDELLRRALVLYATLPSADPLRAFKDSFVARYEREEVPLLEALDDEYGIAFELPTRASAFSDRAVGVLADLLVRGTKHPAGEVELTGSDVASLANDVEVAIPNAFRVDAYLGANSIADLHAGRFALLLGGVAGPSGAEMFGRFCHLDSELRAHVEAFFRREEALSPAILAEIAHLPSFDRAGNVTFRPALREHAIALFGIAGDHAKDLPLRDLTLSVANDRIVLRSRTLGVEVAPRLTTAHNYRHPNNLRLYAFLCLLQHDRGHEGGSWRWGPLERASFLPRVRMGKTVLRLAEWKLRLDALTGNSSSRSARCATFWSWHRENNLPRHVVIADRDNHLPVDCDSPIGVEIIWQMMRRHKTVRLVEQFPAYDQAPTTGPEGSFVSHIVVPFLRRLGPQKPTIVQGPAPSATRRRFSPASEWLYAKMYGGSAVLERLLVERIFPLIQAARDQGAVDKWFFVRYGDPDQHFRLRLHGPRHAVRSEILPKLDDMFSELLSSRQLARVQYDTYVREVERYGGPEAMDIAETIFQVDSEAVVTILATSSKDERARLGLLLGMRSVHQMLCDFGCSLADCLDVYRTLDRVIGESRHAHSAAYRERRSDCYKVLDGSAAEIPDLPRLLAPLERRSEELARVIREWGFATSSRVDRAGPASSFTHMALNRLGLSTEEPAIIGLLRRTCQAFVAQSKESRS